MKKLAWLAAFLLLLPAGIYLVGSMLSGFLYPSPNYPVGKPPDGFTEVSIPYNQSDSVIGWFHANDSARPAILYFHGNGENLQTMQMSGMLDLLKSFGHPVLAVDYPGYGRSTGKAAEADILAASDAAAQWLDSRNSTSSGWIAAGWSLGAAVATQTAARNPQRLRGLIVLSAWSSLREVAALHYSDWILRLFLSEKYDSVAAAAKVNKPALVLHGEQDTLIPASLGEKLSRAFPNARWILLPNTEHNDLLSHPAVPKEISSFLHKL